MEATNKSVCTHSVLISNRLSFAQHSASALIQCKTKVLNSLTLEDPP